MLPHMNTGGADRPTERSVCFVCDAITTHVKQKKSVVEPTRKKVAADTGT